MRVKVRRSARRAIMSVLVCMLLLRVSAYAYAQGEDMTRYGGETENTRFLEEPDERERESPPPEVPDGGDEESQPPENLQPPEETQGHDPGQIPVETEPAAGLWELKTAVATPSEIELPQEGCATVWELRELLEHGGAETIYLEDDIALEPGEEIYIYVDRRRSVDMNGHRLFIPIGARLSITGPVWFEGTVCGEALIEAEGRLRIDKVHIRARGEEAVALRISDGNAAGERCVINNTQICVSGRNSRAVLWEQGACEVENIIVEADGQGSTGIWAGGDVSLVNSSISADGMSVVSGAGAIFLDMSSAQPWPDHASKVQWEVYCDTRISENGISVTAGRPYSEFYEKLPDEIPYIFFSPQKNKKISSNLKVIWDNLPEDISVPGQYTAIARPLLDAGDIRPPDTYVPIYVVSAETPHIQEIFRMENTVVFRYLAQIRQSERVTLYCSCDGGKTWQDAASMEGCTAGVSSDNAVLDGLMINHTYLFKLVVSGGPMEGESAAVAFSYYDDDTDRFGQGDSDNGDRDDQGEKLPDTDSSGELSGESSGEPSRESFGESSGESSGDPSEPPGYTTVTISLTGQELMDQTKANPGQVTLLHDNIKVIVPSASLKALALSGKDMFTAVLREMPNGETEVRFWMNQEEIYLSGAQVNVKGRETRGGTLVTDKAGKRNEQLRQWDEDGRAAERTAEQAAETVPSPVQVDKASSKVPGTEGEDILPPVILTAVCVAALVIWKRQGGDG